MARYSFTAVDVDGREVRDRIEAASEAAARAALKARNLLPVKLAPAGDARPQTYTRGAPAPSIRAKLNHRDRMIATRQLATLIDASVAVDEALDIVAGQQEHASARKVMTDLRDSVREGMRMADGMARHPSSFPGAFRAAVAGGENSGKLGTVLKRLADHLTRDRALRSKVTTAMVYPAALLVIATAVVAALMIFVVPTLIEQFRHLRGELPLITRILIWVSNVLTNFWPLILAGLVVAGALIGFALRQRAVRLRLDRAFLTMPVIGRHVRDVNASRFLRSVAVMTASGLPVLEAVQASRDAAPNLEVSRLIGEMASRIEEGEPLSHAMQRSGVIPTLAVFMAVGGENSGELPSMLERAADHIDQEFEAFIQAALSVVEPAIILLMGGIVASIILAIMLPILQLNQLAGG
jgi:general secretion pathway protein F